MITEQSRDNTLFLRFLAIILVINSHMDSLYPVPMFATGGAMGNSLFFMLSAFGLLLSENHRPQTFTQYYVKRLVRIYPVVWTNVLFLVLPITLFYYFTSTIDYQTMTQVYYLNNPLTVIGMIFYPPYWFLQALMFFYLVGFFFLKNYTNKKTVLAMLILAIIYVVSYAQFSNFSMLVIEQTIAFKLIFYAMVFLFGIYFASINDKIIYSGVRDYMILVGIVILIYLHKILWMKGIATEYQFIQQLLIFPMLYYFMKISHSPLIVDVIMKRPVISSVITLIGAMTLELYIVHGTIRPIVVKYLPGFPENVAVYLIFVFLISYLFYRGNSKLLQHIKKKSL